MPKFETVPGTYTMALMCRITKKLWITGKAVIVDSGFYVLKVFICMYDILVYGSAVVKNSRYCTSVIYGDQINAHSKKSK